MIEVIEFSIVHDYVLNEENYSNVMNYLEYEDKLESERNNNLLKVDYPEHIDIVESYTETISSNPGAIQESIKMMKRSRKLEDKVQFHSILMIMNEDNVFGSVSVYIDSRVRYKDEIICYFIGIKKSELLFDLQRAGLFENVSVSRLLIPAVMNFAREHGAGRLVVVPLENMEGILELIYGFERADAKLKKYLNLAHDFETPSFHIETASDRMAKKIHDPRYRVDEVDDELHIIDIIDDEVVAIFSIGYRELKGELALYIQMDYSADRASLHPYVVVLPTIREIASREECIYAISEYDERGMMDIEFEEEDGYMYIIASPIELKITSRGYESPEDNSFRKFMRRNPRFAEVYKVKWDGKLLAEFLILKFSGITYGGENTIYITDLRRTNKFEKYEGVLLTLGAEIMKVVGKYEHYGIPVIAHNLYFSDYESIEPAKLFVPPELNWPPLEDVESLKVRE